MTGYREAGVDLAAADRLVDRIGPLVTRTWGPEVVGGFGGFAAGIELPPGYRRPVLMMTTDGVGTKLELARLSERWEGIGFDLVAMCVDDLVAVGARPLALVDYLAVGRIVEARDAAIVDSIAQACRQAGCALLGGETAEHPGVMSPDQIDLAGAAMGVVEHGSEVTGAGIKPGHLVIGLASPNLRSNGFSLVRSLFGAGRLDQPFPGEDATVAEVLLRPSVIYAQAVVAAVATGAVAGMAHITGGGIPGNLVRVLPAGVAARIDRAAWAVPDVFEVIRRQGDISAEEMARVFNLGIGFCLVVAPDQVATVLEPLARHDPRVVGRIEAGERRVEFG